MASSSRRNPNERSLYHRSSSSSPFASSTASFVSRSDTFFTRSSSPTHVSLSAQNPSRSPYVRVSVDRPASPNGSISVRKQSSGNAVNNHQKKTCMCSPTTHPGSFRCSLHKNLSRDVHLHNQMASYQSRSLNFRRSAMTNSLVRIGGVEGEMVRRALSALIRPSSHHQRRRSEFQSRPSRLSVMSKAEDL